MTPSQIIKDKLVALSLGAFAGNLDFAIYLGRQPNTPSRCTTLYDTGGAENPEPALLLKYPSVQARVRGSKADYVVAYDWINQIQNALLGVVPFDATNGDHVSGIVSIGDIGFMGYDANEQPEFVWNMKIFLEPVAISGGNRRSL